MSAPQPSPRDFALLLALSVCWGLAFFFIKLALPTATPAVINLGRMGVAAAALLVLIRAMHLSLPPFGPVWGYLLAVAILGNALPYWLIAVAQERVDSGLASILIGATPLIAMVMAHFVTHDEKLTPMRVAGFALGFTGLIVLIGPEALKGLGGDLFAQALLLVACVSFSANALVARRMPPLSVPISGFGMTTLGALIMFPFAAASDPGLSTRPDTLAMIGIVGVGLISTGLATLLFFTLVRSAGATFVVAANYLTPVVALSLGVLVLGEEPTWNALAAFALICTGIWVAHRPARA
jgi:drug/metabolite transporter (DMT)-like permease